MKQATAVNQQVNYQHGPGWDNLGQKMRFLRVTRPEKSLHFWFVNTELNLHF